MTICETNLPDWEMKEYYRWLRYIDYLQNFSAQFRRRNNENLGVSRNMRRILQDIIRIGGARFTVSGQDEVRKYIDEFEKLPDFRHYAHDVVHFH